MSSPSRYPTSAPLTLPAADGRTISYLPRRFLPRPDTVPVAARFVLQAGQRTDLVAALTLNDPQLSWLLADANGAERPTDLGRPGDVIVVPGGALPGVDDAL
jgi:hypothetical protein